MQTRAVGTKGTSQDIKININIVILYSLMVVCVLNRTLLTHDDSTLKMLHADRGHILYMYFWSLLYYAENDVVCLT